MNKIYFIMTPLFILLFVSLVSFYNRPYHEQILLDEFFEYLEVELEEIITCKNHCIENCKKEEDVYQYYYFLGLQDAAETFLQEYKEKRINDHLQLHNDR